MMCGFHSGMYGRRVARVLEEGLEDADRVGQLEVRAAPAHAVRDATRSTARVLYSMSELDRVRPGSSP